ncbi:MAG: ATP-grasp domain-containing protein [Tissierellia bacterium]|nr:ATP-grasp domain-containing protein [Tissierellia bacterium]
MKIIDLRALRGPNYYSRHSVILMKLDIAELENKPSDLVPGFKDNVDKIMPTLYEHTCSPGRIGGFYERLTRGTWAGHIVEHIAIELQCLAGYEVSFGKTFNTDRKGIYKVVFRYLEEDVGLRAAEMSVNIVQNLFEGKLIEIDPLVSELKEIGESAMLGPSTKSIVDEATRRGISHIRLNESSYVQLGQGKNQRRIQATMVDDTSAIGVEIADDKALTKSLLSSMGIPVAEGYPVHTLEEAISVANSIGYPVVVKPLVGNHGRGITTNITCESELQMALNKSKEICESSIVEKYLLGFDYRILVINGKFVAATHREPAFVIGNGRDTIEALINEINKDPQRGYGHEKNLTRIKIDHMTEQVLSNKDLL